MQKLFFLRAGEALRILVNGELWADFHFKMITVLAMWEALRRKTPGGGCVVNNGEKDGSEGGQGDSLMG